MGEKRETHISCSAALEVIGPPLALSPLAYSLPPDTPRGVAFGNAIIPEFH